MRAVAKKFYGAIALTLAAMMLTATVAVAAVTFDPEKGTGFVGKGDVQLALGMNDKQLQQAAKENLAFTYTDEATYAVPCIQEGKKETKYNTFQREQSVNSQVQYEGRLNKNGEGTKINGFNLTGYGASNVEGNVQCPGGWDPDPDAQVELLESTGGVLSVNGTPLQ